MDLLDIEADLRKRFHADAIVNAMGLGTATTTSDNLYLLRGAFLRLHNDGTRSEKLERALVVQNHMRAGHDEQSFAQQEDV